MFFDKLYGTLSSIPGSFEREQILFAMKKARKIVVEDDVSKYAVRVMKHGSRSVLENYDLLSLKDEVLWIEYNHEARALEARDDAYKIVGVAGCLLIKDEKTNNIIIFFAYETVGGNIFTSYHLMRYSKLRLKTIKKISRLIFNNKPLVGFINDEDLDNPDISDLKDISVENFSDKIPENCELLVSWSPIIYITEGLKIEMSEWQEIKIESKKFARALKQSEQEIMGENFFIQILLIVMNSPGIVFEKKDSHEIMKIKKLIHGKTGFKKMGLPFIKKLILFDTFKKETEVKIVGKESEI